MANYRLIAIQVGDTLKYLTTVNGIHRAARSIFRFRCDDFPNDAITSIRAQLIHNWILSLARQRITEEERNNQLWSFIEQLCPDEQKLNEVRAIVEKAGISLSPRSLEITEFINRNFHPFIIKHCRKLFNEGNYFHAVFEACKLFNKLTREKSKSSKDGESLMMDVWGWQNGVLKVTACQTETDKNVQDGIRFLSAGLMRAIRNPTAHEPALDWPIDRKDCLDMLSFVSFLFRQLDKSVYFKGKA